jgi:hypothetical protein
MSQGQSTSSVTAIKVQQGKERVDVRFGKGRRVQHTSSGQERQHASELCARDLAIIICVELAK